MVWETSLSEGKVYAGNHEVTVTKKVYLWIGIRPVLEMELDL